MKNINIRFGDALHAELKAAAERDDRSLNGEVLWLLKVGLDETQMAAGRRWESTADSVEERT